MTYTLIPNIWYTITPETDCDIDTPNGISIHLPAGIQYFHFADCVSIDISGTATVTQNPPLFKPASASALGGGYIESNLNVGHGASAAVPAQCVLTPGADLDIGGTLEHDGSAVELVDRFAELDIAVSHPEYGGKLEVVDNGQTLYVFDIPAALGDFASIELTLGPWEMNGIEFALDKGNGDTLELAYDFEGDFSLDDFVEFLNSGAEGSLGDFAVAQSWAAGIKITLKAPAFAGAAGDAVSYASRAMSPFTNEDGETFSGGGENARDLAGLVEAMQDDDATVEVEVNSGNDGVLLTSKLGGAAGAYNVVNAEGGDLWLGVDDALAIANPRTLEDLAGAITEDATYMQLASASVSDGKIVLTAPTEPTAAQYNGLAYTATGCFGSGTVKQGSTTRGKNAVEQTAFKIYLNGEELDVEPAPLPTVLTPTTAMRNGGVYTVAAAGTGLDFSAVTIGVNATARIWLDYENATDVEWPHGWVWLTEDGLQPEFALFKRFKLEIENDAVATTAKVADSYPYALEYTHTVLTSTNYADDELELFLVPGETENPAYTNNAWAMFNHSGSSLGYYAADWGKGKNMLGEDLPVVVESAPPPPFEQRRWCVCTFRTSAPVDFAGLAASNLGGMAIHIVLQAWNDGGWVTCGAAAVDVQKTDALHVINHVTTDKWRLLISSSKAETFVGKVRLFVNR